MRPLRPIAVVVLCVAARFAAAAETAAPNYDVATPPPALKLDPFYKKCVMLDGLPIVASERTSDYALKEAAFLVDQMLVNRRDVIKALAEQGVHVSIMARDEFQTTLPEHSFMKTPDRFWDRRARGMGAGKNESGVMLPSSGAEENLLCFPGDPYPTESIFVHEFGHTIHDPGMTSLDKDFDATLEKTYRRALEKGLWKNTYAAENHHEYWAEGIQSWFNTNRPKDAIHNGVDTREKLKEYDPDLAALIERTLGDVRWRYKRPPDRSAAERRHLDGYDFAKSPRFEWPAEIKDATAKKGVAK